MINVWYYGSFILLSLCCDLVFSVVSKLSGLVPCCRSRTTPGELSGDFFFFSGTHVMALSSSAKTKINHPLRNPCVNCVLDPAAFLEFVCCACQASELPVCRRLLEERMCPEMPGGKEGSHTQPLPGVLCGTVRARWWQQNQPRAEIACFRWFGTFAVKLCLVELLKFNALFCCSVLCEWLSVSFLLHFHFAEINCSVTFV